MTLKCHFKISFQQFSKNEKTKKVSYGNYGTLTIGIANIELCVNIISDLISTKYTSFYFILF